MQQLLRQGYFVEGLSREGEHPTPLTGSGSVFFTRLNVALYIWIDIAFIPVERTLWNVWMFDVVPLLLGFLVFPFAVSYQFAMLFAEIRLRLPFSASIRGCGLVGVSFFIV